MRCGKEPIRWLVGVLVVAALSAPAASAQHPPPPPPPSSLQITADPALYPGFDRAVSDYVTRCTGSEPVRVTLSRPSTARVVIDGQSTHVGTSTVPVSLGYGQSFQISITAGGQTTSHYVRCLPSDFFRWTASRSGATQAEWYMVTPAVPASPYAAIFDTNGVPVWWMRGNPPPIDAKLLANGNLAWIPKTGFGFVDTAGVPYEEHRLDGTTVRSIAAVGVPTDFHDLQLLPSGNYLVLGYRPRDGVDLRPIGGPSSATVLDGEIQEITPAGNLVWSWNSKDHVALSETGRWASERPARLPDGRSAYDLVHINSVEPDGAGLLASFRHLDAVLRISKATGAVLWKLGGTTRPESLTVVGDSRGGPTTFGGQHDARVYGDGTVSVYDNGTNLHRAPRAVRYRIDTAAKTATLVEQVTEAGAPTSFCCGSTRKLAGGNWVSSWTTSSLITEATTAGNRVFALTLETGLLSYRAFPVPTGVLSRTALRNGMSTMYPR